MQAWNACCTILVTLSGNREVGQAGAIIERILPYAGDAARNRDAGQFGPIKDRIRTVPNDCDQQVVDVGWNDNNTAKSGLSGDGDGVRIAGIYGIIETIT